MPPSSPYYDPESRLRAPRCDHGLQIVLVQPEIPPNTGNIARLCAATSCHLHLVHPLGFDVSDKAVRRAGLDYWHLVHVTEHIDYEAFKATLPATARCHYFSGKAARSFYEVTYRPLDYLIFGKESSGLCPEILQAEQEHLVAIPTIGAVRSLNLANSAALGIYEALRQLGAFNDTALL